MEVGTTGDLRPGLQCLIQSEGGVSTALSVNPLFFRCAFGPCCNCGAGHEDLKDSDLRCRFINHRYLI